MPFIYKNQVPAYKVFKGDSVIPLRDSINPKGNLMFKVEDIIQQESKIKLMLSLNGSMLRIPHIVDNDAILKGCFASNA
jgi:hypothetical protein